MSQVADSNFSSVVLLLPFDGANGSTLFPDLSLSAHPIYSAISAALSTTQSKFGGSSLNVPGSASYIYAPSHADFQVFGGNFTIEFWAWYAASTGNQCMIELGSSTTNRANISLVSGQILYYTQSNSGNGGSRISATAPSNSAQHHIALTMASGTQTLWLDGTSAGTSSNTVFPTGNLIASIGSNRGDTGGTNDYTGYLDMMRITKGVARYTTAFTPPAVPFPNGAYLLSGTVKDSSGNNIARTVNAYLRSTGALVGSDVSDGTTGAFAIAVPTNAAHYCVALDSGGTPANALIYDSVTPL